MFSRDEKECARIIIAKPNFLISDKQETKRSDPFAQRNSSPTFNNHKALLTQSKIKLIHNNHPYPNLETNISKNSPKK